MKILIPVFGFGKSGGFRVLSQLANIWKKMGMDISFVVGNDMNEPYYPTLATIVSVNKKGEIVKNTHKELMTFYERFIGTTKYLKENINEKDIVLASHNITAWSLRLARKKSPYNFYYVQAYEPELYKINNFKNLVMKMLACLSYNFRFTRIVNSEIYINYKNLKSNYVIPPGLDLDTYWTKEKQCAHDIFVIGCIGRCEEWKGSNDVGRAVDLLHSRGIKVKLKVAFNRIECDDYELVKPDGDEKLADYYRSLDILVAPGWLQLGAIHYPVIEAMACGIPVITTGYFPANERNAYIVPVKDPESISRKIEYVMENYDEALMKAKEAVVDIQQFSWEVIGLNFIEILKKESIKDTKAGLYE